MNLSSNAINALQKMISNPDIEALQKRDIFLKEVDEILQIEYDDNEIIIEYTDPIHEQLDIKFRKYEIPQLEIRIDSHYIEGLVTYYQSFISNQEIYKNTLGTIPTVKMNNCNIEFIDKEMNKIISDGMMDLSTETIIPAA